MNFYKNVSERLFITAKISNNTRHQNLSVNKEIKVRKHKLIDTVIHNSPNIAKEYKENISKHVHLTIKLRDLLELNKIKITPVIVSVKQRSGTYWQRADRQPSSAQIKQHTVLQPIVAGEITKTSLCVLCELKTLT